MTSDYITVGDYIEWKIEKHAPPHLHVPIALSFQRENRVLGYMIDMFFFKLDFAIQSAINKALGDILSRTQEK